MKTLIHFLKSYKYRMLIGMVCKLLEALFELSIPFIMAMLIDEGMTGKNSGAIVKYSLILLILTLSGYVFALICQFLASRISQGVGTDIRNQLFAKINRLPQHTMDEFSQSTLQNRLNNDIREVQLGVAMFVRLFVRIPPLCIGGIILTLLIDVKISLILLIAIPILFFIIIYILKFNIRVFKLLQKKLDSISQITKDNLVGSKEIRVFGRQKSEQKRFEGLSDDYSELAKKSIRVASLFNPLTTIVINISIVALIYFTSIQITLNNLTIGDLVAMLNYVSLILSSLLVLTNMMLIFSRALTSMGRVDEILCQKEEDFSGKQIIQTNLPIISFENVFFSYSGQGEDELIDLNFDIAEGEFIGIVGKTASGKTTIANLMQKLYRVKSGEIKIYGENIDNISSKEIRKFIFRTQQKPSLFSGTIAQNITCFASSIDYDRLQLSLELSQSLEFVEKLEGKEQFVLSRNANNLSGGQKQRLQIARTLYQDAKVLIFDDCFYALDDATQQKVFEGIATLKATKILITQRKEYVKNADKIINLDKGKIISQ